jgi:hypothetical protein
MRNRDDERRHLQYIESCLTGRSSDSMRDVEQRL